MTAVRGAERRDRTVARRRSRRRLHAGGRYAARRALRPPDRHRGDASCSALQKRVLDAAPPSCWSEERGRTGLLGPIGHVMPRPARALKLRATRATFFLAQFDKWRSWTRCAASSTTGGSSPRRSRAARSCGTRGRRARRRAARRPPSPPARAASTASSPTFCAHAATPRRAGRRRTSPSAGSARARPRCARATARSTTPRRCGRRARRVDAEQDRVAVAVLPQLLDRERVARGLALPPEPPRERLQKCASPVSRVRRSASSSIQASMSTRPVPASWTIAARSSGCIAERDPEPRKLVARARSRPRPSGVLVEDRREQRRLRDLEAPRRRARASPAPPDAITGIETASATARVSSRS